MSRERDGSEERGHSRSSRQSDCFVKLHGISSSLDKDDIKGFLSPCRVAAVHLFDNSTTSPDDCFVELESEVDVKDALKKSGLMLNKKEIEVKRTTSHECNFHVKHKGMVTWREPVIRMSGLPFVCTMADVQNFFEGIEIARNGIYITRDMADQALGNGFVAFVNMDNAYKAIDAHDQKRIQHRYIELFPSTYDEAKRRIMNDARSNARQFVGEDETEETRKDDADKKPIDKQRSRSRSRQRSRSTSRDRRQRELKRRHSPSVSPPPRSRPPPRSVNQRSSNDNQRRRSRSRSPVRRSSSRSDEHLVKIRGMPYTVVEEDVRKFFPSSCQPTRIEIMQDRRMKRPNGNGYLYFNSVEEVDEAMKYDRKYMGSRYIELYFDSPRYASLANRRKKPDGHLRRSSRSSSRSRYNRRSRSRSDSMH